MELFILITVVRQRVPLVLPYAGVILDQLDQLTEVGQGAFAVFERGQPLLVMEAMKMEYTMKSEGPGVITAVNVKAGDQVTAGKVLVQIKPMAAAGEIL